VTKPKTPKTVLITGASSGIGEALAIEYGSRGAHVALVARREAELAVVAEKVMSRGGRATVIPCDVANDQAIFDAVRRGDQELGGLDMVIANAGVGSSGHASTLKWQDTARLIDVNIKGAFATLSAAIPIFLAQQRGQLVGVSSLAGKRGLPTSGAYSASKAALSTFLETLRVDLRATCNRASSRRRSTRAATRASRSSGPRTRRRASSRRGSSGLRRSSRFRGHSR